MLLLQNGVNLRDMSVNLILRLTKLITLGRKRRQSVTVVAVRMREVTAKKERLTLSQRRFASDTASTLANTIT